MDWIENGFAGAIVVAGGALAFWAFMLRRSVLGAVRAAERSSSQAGRSPGSARSARGRAPLGLESITPEEAEQLLEFERARLCTLAADPFAQSARRARKLAKPDLDDQALDRMLSDIEAYEAVPAAARWASEGWVCDVCQEQGARIKAVKFNVELDRKLCKRHFQKLVPGESASPLVPQTDKWPTARGNSSHGALGAIVGERCSCPVQPGEHARGADCAD